MASRIEEHCKVGTHHEALTVSKCFCVWFGTDVVTTECTRIGRIIYFKVSTEAHIVFPWRQVYESSNHSIYRSFDVARLQCRG